MKMEIGTRSDVTEHIGEHRETINKRVEGLEKISQDLRTVRETIANLDFGGTEDGANEVKEHIDAAENVAGEEFDRDTGELDEAQQVSETYEGEIKETRTIAEGDKGKLEAASGKVEFQGAVEQLNQSKESALRDIDFLSQQVERAREAREESERIQQQLNQTRHQK